MNACVDVWTESVAHLPPHAYHITPSEVSRSMSGADSSVGGGSAATTSEEAGPAAWPVPSAASPDPNKREVPRPLVVCMRLFLFFPVVVVCTRLLNLDVMKREVACPPVRHSHIQQQLPNTGISRVPVYQQGRYHRKTKYRLPSRNYLRVALPPEDHRHILVLPFPSIPSDIVIPYTVEFIPSCPITTDIYHRHILVLVSSVKVVTVKKGNNTDYRQQNYRQVAVPPPRRPPTISLPSTTLEINAPLLPQHSNAVFQCSTPPP